MNGLRGAGSEYFMRRLLFVILFAVTLFEMRGEKEYKEFQRGDLIFQVEGSSDFSRAIADATALSDSLRLVHVAIIDIDSLGNAYILEASERDGVCVTSMDDFIRNRAKVNGKPGYVVKRINFEFPVEEAVQRAKEFLGQPYDWCYLPDNNMVYCSELIYESYLNENGEHIFSTRPMNFKDKNGEYPDFWIKLFEGMNMEIPQGVGGTNPNDMFYEPFLVEIFRSF